MVEMMNSSAALASQLTLLPLWDTHHSTSMDRLPRWQLVAGTQSIRWRHLATAGACIIVVSVVLLTLHSLIPIFHLSGRRSHLPVVNRRYAFEPGIFSRFRWAFNSVQILNTAAVKHQDQPYLLARGDADFTVLPPRYVPELNRLPQNTINSRMSHSNTMLGHLNQLDVVLETAVHVKVLLHRIVPALGDIQQLIQSRIDKDMRETLPQSDTTWMQVEPLKKVVHLVSHAMAVTLVGAPLCDDPEFVPLLHQHTTNMFAVTLLMRLVPAFLQPALVWLMPDKWRLQRSWRTLRQFVVPEVQRRKAEMFDADKLGSTNFISLMLEEARSENERDSNFLTRMIGSVAAGGAWSTAALIGGSLFNIVACPGDLQQIREEIRSVHEETNGFWNLDAFNKLEKLDSALKETSRLAPGTMLVYARKVLHDLSLSDGTFIKKNSFLCISSHSRAHDPDLFPDPDDYQALRAYNKDLSAHRSTPFRGIDREDFRWGDGRWSCPGRFFANLVAKMVLVKLLDEYEFKFVDGEKPTRATLHEFVFYYPTTPLLMRRRASDPSITYGSSRVPEIGDPAKEIFGQMAK